VKRLRRLSQAMRISESLEEWRARASDIGLVRKHLQLVCGPNDRSTAPTHCLQHTDVGISDDHIRLGVVDCARAGAMAAVRLAGVEYRWVLEDG